MRNSLFVFRPPGDLKGKAVALLQGQRSDRGGSRNSKATQLIENFFVFKGNRIA